MKMLLTILSLLTTTLAAQANEARYLSCNMEFGQTSTNGSLYSIKAKESSSGNSFENVEIQSWQVHGSFKTTIATYGNLVELKRAGRGVVYTFMPDQSLLRISFPSDFKAEEKREEFNAKLSINDPHSQQVYSNISMTCSLKTFAEMNN